MIQQSSPGLSTDREGDPALGCGETARSTSPGGQQATEGFGKGLPPAGRVAT
jgi:hypothetical protein